MRVTGLVYRLQFVLIFVIGLGVARMLPAATPTFTITASSVTVPGRGSAASQFTLTSVGGFTGQVGITCVGPNINLSSEPVLPLCDHPVQNYTIPATGSVTGTMDFYPPWVDGYGFASLARPSGPAHPAPLAAGVFAGVALFGLRFRKMLSRRAALFVAAAGLISLAGFVGCIGQGGLAMTPGTYAYTLSGASPSGIQTATVSVTVRCDSCP